LRDRGFSFYHEVHEGHEERKTEIAKPLDLNITFSSFVLFVSFVVGYLARNLRQLSTLLKFTSTPRRPFSSSLVPDDDAMVRRGQGENALALLIKL
jgi:hypothetical protein